MTKKLVKSSFSKIYNLCSQIPTGHVSTYKYIAEYLHTSPRMVGQALKNNPFSSSQVPCHRVIASNYFIGGYYGEWGEGEKVATKRKLLAEEGELFSEISKEEQSALSSEIEDLEVKKDRLINKIKEQIIEEEGISQSVVMEIRPGPGGDEAGLFVRDLYRKGVFNYLRNETGVHRVQRIPETAKVGKMHTSTATVVILPEFQDIKLDISEKNLKIETCRSSGAGGQHVNTTDSAVKVTYTYTTNGKTETITATSQDGRSQHDNRARALTVLKDRLLEKLQTDQAKEVGNLRSSMIGTAERSENFRTYNFQENRVVDKRLKIKLRGKVDRVMEGDLEEICQKSIDYEVEKRINKS
nr:14067_t:CDS:2 [Entrophospora candida]